MKTLKELIDVSNPAWTLIQDWISKSTNNATVLPVDMKNAEDTLYNLQFSTKSTLGGVIYMTGGILVENNWLRIIGSGHKFLPRNIYSWNQWMKGKNKELNDSLLIADDIVGGFFALNGGSFPGKLGNTYYLAPDTLKWEDLEMTYSDFLQWALLGNVKKFYESFRWEGWEKEVKPINGDKGILIYPFLWAVGPDLINRSRKVVPIQELWQLNLENKEKIGPS